MVDEVVDGSEIDGGHDKDTVFLEHPIIFDLMVVHRETFVMMAKYPENRRLVPDRQVLLCLIVESIPLGIPVHGHLVLIRETVLLLLHVMDYPEEIEMFHSSETDRVLEMPLVEMVDHHLEMGLLLIIMGERTVLLL